MRQYYGKTVEGIQIGGVRVITVGINDLVKKVIQVRQLDKDILLNFRAADKKLKIRLAENLRLYMKKSCVDKAATFSVYSKGLIWIGNTLEVIPGGVGRGASGLQVVMPDKDTRNFARIYDTGGTILPKKAKYLSVPTRQLKAGSSFGLPIVYQRDKKPRSLLSEAQASGMKTVSIKLDSERKMILGRMKKTDFTGKTKYTNVPLFILEKSVTVTATKWATDGMFNFVSKYAIPELMKEGRFAMAEVAKGL